MIYYYDINTSAKEQYNNILAELEERYKKQNKKIQIILECLSNINNILQSENISKIINTNSLIILLENFKNISDELKSNKESINVLISNFKNIFPNGIENTEITDDIKLKLDEYNNKVESIKINLNKEQENYENFIIDYIKSGVSIKLSSDDSTISSKEDIDKVGEEANAEEITPVENTHKVDEKDKYEKIYSTQETYITNDNVKANTEALELKSNAEILDNDTLLISEKKKMVFLPYTVSELQKKLEENKEYSNLQEIIEKEYIIPLSKYKNPIISRFQEAYKLMKKKENASLLESLDLALEVAFKSVLNPAIITACKNLDELDSYLDCIENNELEKFDKFKIQFEILPLKN